LRKSSERRRKPKKHKKKTKKKKKDYSKKAVFVLHDPGRVGEGVKREKRQRCSTSGERL